MSQQQEAWRSQKVSDARIMVTFDDGKEFEIVIKGTLAAYYAEGNPSSGSMGVVWGIGLTGKERFLKAVSTDGFLQLNDYDYRRYRDVKKFHIVSEEERDGSSADYQI